MTYTKTFTKNGFNIKAVLSGEGVDRVAEIFDDEVYVGKLYITHAYRNDKFCFWTHKKFQTSEEGLFDAAKTLIRNEYLKSNQS